MEIHNKVRKVFDLDTDFSLINEKCAKDEHLSKGMVEGHVPRLPAAFDPFEFVVRAILGQQISVQAATTLASRVAAKAGLKSDGNYPSDIIVNDIFSQFRLCIDFWRSLLGGSRKCGNIN